MQWRINLTQREVWHLSLATERWSLGFWNVIPDSIVLFLPGYLTTRQCNDVIYEGDLGHMVLVLPVGGLETKRSTTRAVCDWAPIKILDTEARWASLVGSAPCVLLYIVAGRGLCYPWPHWQRAVGSFMLWPSWMLPYVFLHLTDFNLSPFSVVNCNCEFNSIYYVLGPLRVNYWNWERFWGHPNLQLVSEVRMVWCDCAPASKLAVGSNLYAQLRSSHSRVTWRI